MAEHSAKTGVSLGNSMYDTLRRIVEIILPGIGALYAGVAVLWGLPYVEQVVGTVAAVSVFGGVLLAASRKTYTSSDAPYDGAIVEDTTDPENPSYRFLLNENVDADTVLNKKQIVFKGVEL